MALVTTQVWRHEIEESVTYMAQNYVKWDVKNWITATSNIRDPQITTWIDMKDAYSSAGTVAVTDASGGTSTSDTAKIQVDGGYNEGDVIQVDGTYNTTTLTDVPWTASLTVALTQKADQTAIQLAEAVASNAAILALASGTDADNPEYNQQVELWVDLGNEPDGTTLAITGVTYTPNPATIPPPPTI